MAMSALPLFLVIGSVTVFCTNIWMYIVLRVLIATAGIMFSLTPVTLGNF